MKVVSVMSPLGEITKYFLFGANYVNVF